jgi:replicative DNA helicase
MSLVDKKCIQQVLGCLLKNPQYLSEVDKYRLTLSDFSTRFEKYIFGAIQGLYYSGAKKISPFDVENYLSSNDVYLKLFNSENGVEYLQDIEEYSNVENFPYYYNKLKKLNLLNDFKKQGIDISDFYVEDLLDPRSLEVNQSFEELSIQDIVLGIKKKILKLEADYVKSEEVQSWVAADEIDEIIEGFGDTSQIGLPIQGKILNKVINGAELGALTIRSAPSGVGKTRHAVGDACTLAYPIRYNSVTAEWEQVGSNQKVLFIITEQHKSQVLKMIIAYLTDINESKFKFAKFTNEERKRIEQAKLIMKQFRDNFILIRIPNPTIELVKTMTREACITNDIGYVFYDYIFIGPALLNEFRGFSIRNDEALLMFATALKDLAVELNVSVFTSTQVNAKADENKDIRNEASLAGGRSTINKADNGVIMARPTNEELDVVGNLHTVAPNVVTDVFKVRSGEWNQVRIWSRIDLGTMRKEDLFITDSRLDPITDFYDGDVESVIDWEDEGYGQIMDFMNKLNQELREG